MIARIWQGRTRSTKGNLGVRVLREVRDGVAHFMTISFDEWHRR
jgi:hypothetical protein